MLPGEFEQQGCQPDNHAKKAGFIEEKQRSGTKLVHH
jgi:hypothetical protein